MPSLEEIKLQINKIDKASKLLGRKEIKELPSILWEDESVEMLIQGIYGNNLGILVATNKRLIFVDKKIIGVKVEDFPYEKLTSIQYETGVLTGKLSIFASGNRANITNVSPKNLVRDFSEYVRSQISTDKNLGKLNIKNDDDTLAKLERLGELMKKGILTEEEFNSEKRKLLGL
jgi:Bacterial PH domain/Short C-terminal domain